MLFVRLLKVIFVHCASLIFLDDPFHRFLTLDWAKMSICGGVSFACGVYNCGVLWESNCHCGDDDWRIEPSSSHWYTHLNWYLKKPRYVMRAWWCGRQRRGRVEGRWGPHKWVGVGRRGPPQALDAAKQTYRIFFIGQKVLPDPILVKWSNSYGKRQNELFW